jgi:hypothetical protein
MMPDKNDARQLKILYSDLGVVDFADQIDAEQR